jgi:GT2 family glycosyltransferase
LVRTSIVKQIGALNDHFFIYYEDVDFSFRIRAAGYKLMFHPNSVIYHIAGMANKAKVKGKEGYANPYVHYLNFRNHIWVLRAYTKWYQWPTTFITLIAYSLAIMLYFVARWRWTKLAMMLKGILHGFTKQSSA